MKADLGVLDEFLPCVVLTFTVHLAVAAGVRLALEFGLLLCFLLI